MEIAAGATSYPYSKAQPVHFLTDNGTHQVVTAEMVVLINVLSIHPD